MFYLNLLFTFLFRLNDDTAWRFRAWLLLRSLLFGSTLLGRELVDRQLRQILIWFLLEGTWWGPLQPTRTDLTYMIELILQHCALDCLLWVAELVVLSVGGVRYLLIRDSDMWRRGELRLLILLGVVQSVLTPTAFNHAVRHLDHRWVLLYQLHLCQFLGKLLLEDQVLQLLPLYVIFVVMGC